MCWGAASETNNDSIYLAFSPHIAMNQEKAKEFFSNYYEGTLEPGLKQALEQAMNRDAIIREDYKDFEQTYEGLGSLKFETIEIPFDLNDKILANIDRHVYETRKNRQPSWMVWLRNVAIAGVSCVALLGAALSLRKLNGPTASAGPIALGNTKDELSIEPTNNHAIVLDFTPSQTNTLTITQGLGGAELSRETVLQGKELTSNLQNPNADAAVFDIQESAGDTRSTLIALPGSSSPTAKAGQGNLEDLAKALASYYKVPVEVHVAEPAVNVNWNFESPDALNAARATLDATRYAITLRVNNLLVISEQ